MLVISNFATVGALHGVRSMYTSYDHTLLTYSLTLSTHPSTQLGHHLMRLMSTTYHIHTHLVIAPTYTNPLIHPLIHPLDPPMISVGENGYFRLQTEVGMDYNTCNVASVRQYKCPVDCATTAGCTCVIADADLPGAHIVAHWRSQYPFPYL